MSSQPTSRTPEPAPAPQPLRFDEAVRARHSTRAFTDERLSPEEIRTVLEDARHTPSNSNAQPWQIHILSGHALQRVGDAVAAEEATGAVTYDFSYDISIFRPEHLRRAQETGRLRHEALGISRDDAAGRKALADRNWHFYDAPHAALVFVPQYGDGARAYGDAAMWGQTFMLALAARGFASVPQTLIGKHAKAVREALGICEEWRLTFAVAFGHEDASAPINGPRTQRASLEETVVLHDTELG